MEPTSKSTSYLANSRQYFRNDFLASIVVFLVALPLCIGIAVAVGVSPARALITGIIGGLIVGSIAGSPLQVSGPAAGLFVIVADILLTQRDRFLANLVSETMLPAEAEASATGYALAALGVAVYLAGMIQLLAGQFKLGRWFRAVSPAVPGTVGSPGLLSRITAVG